MRLENKVAIVTGGGSGIGRATALRFASEGAAVCCADLNLENAARVVNEIESAGGRALAVQVDTADEAACEAMVQQCVAAYGAVDVLMAAAGIGSAIPRPEGGPPQPLGVLDYPIEPFKRVIDVNFYGVLFSDRAVAKWQRAQGRPGSLINVASIAARLPLPGGAYSVSKAACWMITKVLAAELAPIGIRVNAIGPAYIDTPMHTEVEPAHCNSTTVGCC
jgi:NAD(P)-dependent dehydrogenase (short-subunit alcohol dehydrogenase family)